MIIKKQEQIKTTHHIVECNGYTIHRREKLEYDFKEETWVRKSMTWNCDHRGVDIDSKYQFNNKPPIPSSKQLEREYQLRILGL
jgi:hypothetical protein